MVPEAAMPGADMPDSALVPGRVFVIRGNRSFLLEAYVYFS